MALCAAYRLENTRNLQVYSVPAGLGKSRIIVGIVAVLCSKQNPKYKDFHIVYNHRELLDMDKAFLTRICNSCNANVRFSVPDDSMIEVKKSGEVTIIDEFDYIMLDRLAQFIKHTRGVHRVIGLTATAGEELLPIEKRYLSQVHQFAVHDSMIKPSASD